jgi:hypothetical protein
MKATEDKSFSKALAEQMGLGKEQVRCDAIKLNDIRSARRAEMTEY